MIPVTLYHFMLYLMFSQTCLVSLHLFRNTGQNRIPKSNRQFANKCNTILTWSKKYPLEKRDQSTVTVPYTVREDRGKKKITISELPKVNSLAVTLLFPHKPGDPNLHIHWASTNFASPGKKKLPPEYTPYEFTVVTSPRTGRWISWGLKLLSYHLSSVRVHCY